MGKTLSQAKQVGIGVDEFTWLEVRMALTVTDIQAFEEDKFFLWWEATRTLAI
jgi:hypothetical protein